MEIKRLEKYIFFAVVLVACFLRFNQLENVPPHPSLDEVSIGYNAYSILLTGADEFGEKLPILLRAYDDWRPALYVYFVMPFIHFFGLGVLAVRYPSVILSVFTVVASYFLIRELIRINPKNLDENKFLNWLPITVMFLLSVSPWHVYISRLGHEVNIGLSFFVFGLLFFFYYINSFLNKSDVFGKYTLLLSALFMGLSFDSYQSTKIVVPFIAIVLIILFYKILMRNITMLVIAGSLGLAIILPVIMESAKPNALIRFSGTNIFSSTENIREISSKRELTDTLSGNFVGKIFDNRRVLYALLFSGAYLSHFDPTWYFTNINGEPFKIPNFGLLYIFEFPLLIFGIFHLIKNQYLSNKAKVFITLWFFIATLPGAITTGYPHAMRIINVVPVPQIIVGIGIVSIFSYFTNRRKVLILTACLFTIYLIGVVWFYNSYFVLFKRELSNQFQYGVIQALSFVKDHENEYKQIFVSNKKNLSQSYMFYLFSSEYDPFVYQKSGGTGSGWAETKHIIGKYQFFNTSIRHDEKSNTLYIVNADELNESDYNIIKVFNFLDGTSAVVLAEKVYKKK